MTTLIDSLQQSLNFAHPRCTHNPAFKDNRGIGRIGVAGFLLGIIGGVHVTFLLLALTSSSFSSSLWGIRWCLYMVSLCLFHFMEFFTTALYKPEAVTYDSFIINHSKEYTMAALAAWGEFWLELLLFPSLKTQGYFTLLVGTLLLVSGQACRIIAMHTAREHFSHMIMETRTQGHQLVTHGIYAHLRHPSYFGWFWWVVGTQMVLCNPLCAVAYTFVSWKFFASRIKYEEGTLCQFYPQEYPAYRRRTRVGIPLIA